MGRSERGLHERSAVAIRHTFNQIGMKLHFSSQKNSSKHFHPKPLSSQNHFHPKPTFFPKPLSSPSPSLPPQTHTPTDTPGAPPFGPPPDRPSTGPPLRWTAQNFALFSPLPRAVLSWNFGGVFDQRLEFSVCRVESRRPQTPPKFTKGPSPGEGKKREILGPPPFGAPPPSVPIRSTPIRTAPHGPPLPPKHMG